MSGISPAHIILPTNTTWFVDLQGCAPRWGWNGCWAYWKMVVPRVFGDHFFNFLVMYSFLWPLWGVGMTYSGMLSLASQSITHFPFPVLRFGIVFFWQKQSSNRGAFSHRDLVIQVPCGACTSVHHILIYSFSMSNHQWHSCMFIPECSLESHSVSQELVRLSLWYYQDPWSTLRPKGRSGPWHTTQSNFEESASPI